jgi:hypothetical protein
MDDRRRSLAAVTIAQYSRQRPCLALPARSATGRAAPSGVSRSRKSSQQPPYRSHARDRLQVQGDACANGPDASLPAKYCAKENISAKHCSLVTRMIPGLVVAPPEHAPQLPYLYSWIGNGRFEYWHAFCCMLFQQGKI